MEDLSKKKCIPCDGNIPAMEINEIHKYLKKVDGWDVKKNENENFYLLKEFNFENFIDAQNFGKCIGEFIPEVNEENFNDFVFIFWFVLHVTRSFVCD